MITYTEKGSGLHDAIRRAGLHLREENGAWIADDETAVQAIIDGYTIADAQAVICDAIVAYSKALRDKVVFIYSKGETSSWTCKYLEAKAYAGDPSVCPNLALEAEDGGIALDTLVSSVKENAVALLALEARIAGATRRHKDIVKSLTEFDAVSNYDFSQGWPV